MAGEAPNWQGLLKWSLAHSDGTGPNRNLGDEDRKWFMEAVQAQTVDVVKRMKEITLVLGIPEKVLESQGVTSDDIEGLLEELQEHVECIDMANDLLSIGGLLPLLEYMKNSHANLRAKAAEIVTTVVQNNPKSQKLVMEANGLDCLYPLFMSDPDVNVCTKALGAISCLRDALSSESVRLQRKALHLISYLLRENNSDCNTMRDLGFLRVMLNLASREDQEVREAALQGLLELAQEKNWWCQSDTS